MRRCLAFWLIAFALTALPAQAVPPVPPSPTTLAVAQAYIDAVKANDLAAFKGLFAPEALLSGKAWDDSRWTGWEPVEKEFENPFRQTRFLAAYQTPAPKNAGQFVQRYLFLQEVRDCRRDRPECFAVTHTDVVDIRGSQIVRLERSVPFVNSIQPPQLRLDATLTPSPPSSSTSNAR